MPADELGAASAGEGKSAGPGEGGPRPNRIRRARTADIKGLHALEQAAFQPWRRSSRRSLRRSLRSVRQSVWVIEGRNGLVASMVAWHHRRTLRVYGLAVDPRRQGQGLGRRMLGHAGALAARDGAARIVLEADADDGRLLAWYEGLGFRRVRRMDDYYAPGRAAWRLQKRVAD